MYIPPLYVLLLSGIKPFVGDIVARRKAVGKSINSESQLTLKRSPGRLKKKREKENIFK